MEDYYQEKLREIKSLIETDPHKAFMEVSNELNMPYIPRVYEGDFNKLHNELKIILQKEVSTKKLSSDEIVEYLWDEDISKQVVAIENLKTSNLREYKDEIVKWIQEKQKSENMTKAFLYELLVSQEIDIDITVDGIVINPAKQKSMFDNEEFKKGLVKIQELAKNEPSIEKMILEEFERYYLVSFPVFNDNGEELANSLFNIIRKMMGEELILSPKEVAIATKLSNNI